MVALAEAGHLDIGAMVSRRLPLGGVGAALDAMESGDFIRSVLVP